MPMKSVTQARLNKLSPTLTSNISECLQAFLEQDFKLQFDLETCEGVASIRGCEIPFSVGQENLYLNPSFYSKIEPEQSIIALKSFANTMIDNQ